MEELYDILGEFNTQNVEDFVPPPSPPPASRNPPNLTSRRATVKDAAYLTTNMNRFVEPYPGDAGRGIRKEITRFEKWFNRDSDVGGKSPWEPFASKEEWALAGWLMKNVGQKSTDEYLKLPIVREVVILFLKKLYSSSFTRLIARQIYRSTIRIHF
jgi:hypothetical protein